MSFDPVAIVGELGCRRAMILPCCRMRLGKLVGTRNAVVLKIVKTVWPVMLTNVAIGAPLSIFPPLLRVSSAHRSLFACSFRSGCRRRCGGNQDKVDVVVLRLGYRALYRFEPRIGVGCVYRPGPTNRISHRAGLLLLVPWSNFTVAKHDVGFCSASAEMGVSWHRKRSPTSKRNSK